MDRLRKEAKASIYAEKAYQLILQGVREFHSAEDQRLLMNSLLCQCALFSRLWEGEQVFFDLLDRLRQVDLDDIGEIFPPTHH
ncbi:hypothetical protein BZL41_26215 [Pseudomonas sp. PIC25]|nr:hypothetical protein BZL41_26215 [Pseudomonas sp. PIC25]